MTLFGQSLVIWIRDIAIGGSIIGLFLFWQSKDLLNTDGSQSIHNRSLPTLNDGPSQILATNKDNLIYFFAPWCQVCHTSISNLEYLDNQKVNIVRVALDYRSVDEVRHFAQQHNIENSVMLGDEQIQRQFKVNAYPTYYLIDREGRVLGGSLGYSTAVGLKLRAFFATQ